MTFEDEKAKCNAKRRFASSEEAELQARWLFNEGKGQFYVYTCPFCRGAHLSTRPHSNRHEGVPL